MLENIYTCTFTKYTFCDLHHHRCFSDFTCVKIIKDYSLTRQRTYLAPIQEGSAQCRTPQDFRITLKTIEKNTYQRLLRTPLYLRTQKRYKCASVHYRRDVPSLSVHLCAKILRGSMTSWSKYTGSVGTENLVLNVA